MNVFCTSCGQENAAGSAFCDRCGSALDAGCPSCGTDNRAGAVFCRGCGTRLAEPDAEVTSTPPAPAPSFDGGSAELRLVSVLFADLVAFTSYSEGRDPELVRETLTRYFEAVRAVIERHGGHVEKFIGDAVMAAWGAPRANEDDAERAVRAALEVTEAVANLDEQLQARVAVLTGQAAVTVGATDQGMVAGDLVNTAARLQAVAPPGSVLVGETTMQAASGAIAFEAAGEQVLKGKAAPVAAWRAVRVVGERGGRIRGDLLEPPFVGREVELRLLKDLLHQAGEDRRPRLVSVIGPAGIGKSRLAWEFEKYVDGVVENVFWHHGRAPSYGDGLTFWALGEMVRRRAGLHEADDDETTRRRLHECVAEWMPDAADQAFVEPALLALLGLEPAPVGGRDVLFAAWRIFFERIAARGTTVLLFEDLHWADAGQLDFIEHLLEWTRGLPLLVITLARPELLTARPAWGTAARSFTAVGLEPLADASMRSLVQGLVPSLAPEALDQIVQRADGIPLHAVETLRMLLSDGRLRDPGTGILEPAGELGELRIPDTLRALVGSRLDALDEPDRQLLQFAAVLGQRFAADALADIVEQDRTSVERQLRSLVGQEVLELTADPRSPERGQYGFVQSVIREVAYETLSRRERRARHLAAARYFEHIDDDELAGVLPVHYRAALEASDEGPEADALAVQARRALRTAAERALTLGSGRQALAFAESAIELARNPAERAPLLELAAHAADLDSQHERAVELGTAALEAYRAAGEDAAADEALVQHSQILIDAGLAEEVVRLLPPVIERLAQQDAAPLRARLLSSYARACYRATRTEDAIKAADEALAIAESLGLDDVMPEALLNKASAMSNARRVVEPRLLMAAAAEMARANGDLETELRAQANLGVTATSLDLHAASSAFDRLLETCRHLGIGTYIDFSLEIMAWIRTELGEDWDEAIAFDGSAIELALTDVARGQLWGKIEFIQLMRGEDDGPARAERERYLAAAEGTEYSGFFAYHPGWAALLSGRPAEAFRLFRGSLEALAQRGHEARHGMVLAAHLAGEHALAVEALEQMLLGGLAGGAYRGMEALARAGAFALDGDVDAARPLFESAVKLIGDSGRGWWAALAQLDALTLLPDDPVIARWEPEARARFEQLRAAPFLELLDAAVASRDRASSAEPVTDAAVRR